MNHSNFWLNREILKTIFENNEILGYVLYKKLIKNYVNIISNQDIDVTFNNSDENKTNGKIISISSKIDFEKFDVNIGVSLHEASHIKYSDFSKLKDFQRNIPLELYDLCRSKNIEPDIFEKFCFFNIAKN